MICFRAGLFFAGTWTGVRNRLTATSQSSARCKILHLGANNSMQCYRLGPGWRQTSLTEKCLNVLMKKLDMNHVHSWSTGKNWQPGCISRSVLSRSRKSIHLCGCETTSQVLCPVLGSPAHKWHTNGTQSGPRKGHRVDELRGMEHTVCKERLWGLSRLKRRRLREDLTYLVGGHREDGTSLLWGTWWLF